MRGGDFPPESGRSLDKLSGTALKSNTSCLQSLGCVYDTQTRDLHMLLNVLGEVSNLGCSGNTVVQTTSFRHGFNLSLTSLRSWAQASVTNSQTSLRTSITKERFIKNVCKTNCIMYSQRRERWTVQVWLAASDNSSFFSSISYSQ